MLEPSLAQDVATAVGKYPAGVVQTIVLHTQGADNAVTLPNVSAVLVDGEGHAHRTYAAEAGTSIAVVRPDGVVGALLRGVDGMNKYFSHVFV